MTAGFGAIDDVPQELDVLMLKVLWILIVDLAFSRTHVGPLVAEPDCKKQRQKWTRLNRKLAHKKCGFGRQKSDVTVEQKTSESPAANLFLVF